MMTSKQRRIFVAISTVFTVIATVIYSRDNYIWLDYLYETYFYLTSFLAFVIYYSRGDNLAKARLIKSYQKNEHLPIWADYLTYGIIVISLITGGYIFFGIVWFLRAVMDFDMRSKAKEKVSNTCIGEVCGICQRYGKGNNPATHKVGEEFPYDYTVNRHNLTQYVCCKYFEFIMGKAAKDVCDTHSDNEKAKETVKNNEIKIS